MEAKSILSSAEYERVAAQARNWHLVSEMWRHKFEQAEQHMAEQRKEIAQLKHGKEAVKTPSVDALIQKSSKYLGGAYLTQDVIDLAKALEVQRNKWMQNYYDVADAVCRESSGPKDLCRQARSIRRELDCSRKMQLTSEKLEDLIKECLPGGYYCDPQQVADAIRKWHRKLDQDKAR